MGEQQWIARVGTMVRLLGGVVVRDRLFILAVVLAVMAVVVSFWDVAVIAMIRQPGPELAPWLKAAHAFIAYFKGFGKWEVIVALVFLLGMCGMKQRALAAFGALLVAGLLVWPLKLAVQRPRPQGHSVVSFPSGDAATAASFGVVAAAGAPMVIPVAIVMVGAVGSSRVLGFAHYPSDVLAGTSLGIVAGIIGLWVSKRYQLKLRQRHYFLLFVALVGGNAAVGAIDHSANTMSRFMDMYGPVIGAVVLARGFYQFGRRRRGRKAEN